MNNEKLAQRMLALMPFCEAVVEAMHAVPPWTQVGEHERFVREFLAGKLPPTHTERKRLYSLLYAAAQYGVESEVTAASLQSMKSK